MRQLAAISLALFLAAPVSAQDDGEHMMERGLELFLEGLRNEMAPRLEEWQDLAEELGPSMRSFLEEMGPALGSLFEQVQDWADYHPPEVLPNGDIILRKRTDPKPEPEDEPSDGPEITDI